MIGFGERPAAPRPRHIATSARFKLGLETPEDRKRAAELLLEARRFNRMCAWREQWKGWSRNLDLAASFALQTVEASREEDDEQAERIFDRIAWVMASTSGLYDLRG